MFDNDTIAILISFVALLVATLGYLNNRKHIKIIGVRENERNEIRNVLKELKKASDTLKELPKYIYFGLMEMAISDISRVVYENETLNLKIEFHDIETSRRSIDAKSINAESIRNMMKKTGDIKGIIINESPIVNFEDNPDVILNKWFELDGIAHIFARIEDNISKLNEFEYLIDSFDADILKRIENDYEKILELLVDSFHKKVYTFEFNGNMKPSEIEDKIFEMLNYKKISEISIYLSEDVALRIDELRKELIKLILT